MRRIARPPPAGFSIHLPAAQQPSVPVESASVEDVKRQLYIHTDDSLVSPIISTDVPSFVASAMDHHHPTKHFPGHPHPQHHPPHHQPKSKFIHVGQSNLYVLVDGASLFQDSDVLHPFAPTASTLFDPHSMDDASWSGLLALGGSDLRSQIVSDLTKHVSHPEGSSGATNCVQEFEAAIAEISHTVLSPAAGGSLVSNHVDPLDIRTTTNTSNGGKTAHHSRHQHINTHPHPQHAATGITITHTHTSSGHHPHGGLKSHPHTTPPDARPHHPSPAQGPPHPLRRVWSNADIEGLEVLGPIGGGQQGSVHMGRLADGSRCAVKRIDISDALFCNSSDSERQGRKAGIVRELNMVKSLREHPSVFLVAMYNAKAILTDEKKELLILMELMSHSVEQLQRVIGRMPHGEVTRVMQRCFTKQLHGTSSVVPHHHHATTTSTSTNIKEKVYNHSVVDYEVDRQTQCPEVLLSFIAHDVVRSLHELHTVHRRVHCDLKPANIMLSEDKKSFKLGDFGCAVAMQSDGKVVQRHVTLGSKLYRSPELFSEFFETGDDELQTPSSSTIDAASKRGSNAGSVWSAGSNHTGTATSSVGGVAFDGSVDIWALGITLLELANGCHPTKRFQSDFWNFKNKLRFTNMILPVMCSHSFLDFVEKCLNRSPQKRPKAHELLHHPFLTSYMSVSRSSLVTFVNRLISEGDQYQRKVQLEALRVSVVAATKTSDKEKHKRQSAQRWRSFTSTVVKGEPPPATDPKLFPALGE